MDHIIFQYVETRKQRDLIKLHPRTQKNWPENKSQLITKHRKVFSEHIESIDIDNLQQKCDKQDSDRECRVYIEVEMYKRGIGLKNCDDCESLEADTVQ